MRESSSQFSKDRYRKTVFQIPKDEYRNFRGNTRGSRNNRQVKQNSRENFNKLGKRTNPLDKARNISRCAVV